MLQSAVSLVVSPVALTLCNLGALMLHVLCFDQQTRCSCVAVCVHALVCEV